MMPNNLPDNQYQEPEPSTPEIVINNILMGITCVFLIVICFLILAVVTSTIDNQEAIQFRTFEDTFVISNPTLGQEVYVSNPLLSSIIVQKYNSTNSSWAGVSSTNWSYDSSWGSITINASVLEHTITSLRVSADTTYAESPHLTVFTAISISLLVIAIGGIFGIIVWNKRKRQY
jgi:hypothetical protein